jgi:EmrB/QacA subfamily drug resistance transporter
MRKWLPLIAVCLGTFMLLVDVTIVNVALPDMAASLSTSFSGLQWVIDIYALVLAALLMALGAVSDALGRRAVYLGGLGLFALASLASGIAPNAAVLIAARGVQGAGGAAMFATTIALLNSSYTGRDRGTAFGIWGAVAGGAAAAGPVIGGLLTEGLSWRWIFFVNLPVSIVAIVMTLRVIGRDAPGKGLRLDLAGLVSFTAGAAAITLGLIRTSEDGWGSASTIALLAGGVAALVVFAVVESRIKNPLLEPALFRRPTFTGIMVVALLLNAAAFSYLAYSSLWLQTVVGLSPVRAGLLGSAPLSLASFVVSALIGRFLHATNPRWIIGGGMLLTGGGALLQATLGAHSSWPQLMAGLIVCGIGVGLATPTLVSNAMAAVPHARGGMAAGAVNTARQLGYAFGIAVLGSVFSARMTHVITGRGARAAVAQAISGGQARSLLAATPPAHRGALDEIIHAATASGLDACFLVAGLLGLAGSLIAVIMIRRPQALSHGPESHPTAVPHGPESHPTAVPHGPESHPTAVPHGPESHPTAAAHDPKPQQPSGLEAVSAPGE